MKTRICFLMIALCVAFTNVGCNKNNDTPTVDHSAKIVGEWHCSVEEYAADVYVAFYTDGMFDEYQRIGEGRYRHYAGTWSLDKETLSGVYADGVEWGSSYKVSFEGDTMTLTSTNESAEAITYSKEAIPAEVKDEAIEPLGPETFTRADDMRWF